MSSSDSETSQRPEFGRNYVRRLEMQLEDATRRIGELTAVIRDRGGSTVTNSSGPTNPPDDNVAPPPITTGSEREPLQHQPVATGTAPEAHQPGPVPVLHLLQHTHSLPSFALGGAVSLHEYLQRFEEHCQTAYAGSLDHALPLLKTLLTGEVADIFNACGGTETPYARLKLRMLRWVERQDASGHQTPKQRFDGCKRVQNESLPLFALRLSSLFEDAYPAADVQTSKLLRDRLLDNLTPQAADHLKKQERYNKEIHGITLKWDNFITILQCECFEDVNSSLFFSRETPPAHLGSRARSSRSSCARPRRCATSSRRRTPRAPSSTRRSPSATRPSAR